MRAGTSKRNWLLFWCLVFQFCRGTRRNARKRWRPAKKRAATVEVFVWFEDYRHPIRAGLRRFPGDG